MITAPIPTYQLRGLNTDLSLHPSKFIEALRKRGFFLVNNCGPLVAVRLH